MIARRTISNATVCVSLAVVMTLGSGAAADDAVLGRDVISKWSNAIVTVQLVIKMGMAGEGDGSKRESKTEATGTIIDPSGLTVVSLTNTNPADTIREMYGGDEGMEITSEVTDLKIRMPDGKEIPGKVVLRDKELDLAFIRPAEKLAVPVTAVDLAQSAKIDVLDQVLVMSRLGKVANRSIGAAISRVQCVIEKPRKFYIVDPDFGFGSPAFSMDGKVVGIVLLRTLSGQAGDVGGIFGGMSDMGMVPVIVPAEDVAAVAAQAPEASAGGK